MMRRALALARRGEGWVEPNPMVGCVLVRDGHVIGGGFHRRFGGPHAEVNALRSSAVNPRGATAYITLEPCAHTGKTPPCTDALIRAGVGRVVVAMRDPNPLVAGRGLRQLRTAGIEVTVGVLRNEAARLLAPFTTWIVQRRPYVIAKWAQGLDGCLVPRPGASKWISGEGSRGEVHRLRARVDAILVGVGTVLADDPSLTARGVRARRVALRVVLDGRLRIPLNSRLVRTARTAPVLVYTSTTSGERQAARELRKRGVEVIGVPDARHLPRLDAVLRDLAARGVTNLLVEGGPTILSAFFAGHRVDEAWVFTAPRFVGESTGLNTTRALATRPAYPNTAPSRTAIQRIGPDMLHRLWFHRAPKRSH